MLDGRGNSVNAQRESGCGSVSSCATGISVSLLSPLSGCRRGWPWRWSSSRTFGVIHTRLPPSPLTLTAAHPVSASSEGHRQARCRAGAHQTRSTDFDKKSMQWTESQGRNGFLKAQHGRGSSIRRRVPVSCSWRKPLFALHLVARWASLFHPVEEEPPTGMPRRLLAGACIQKWSTRQLDALAKKLWQQDAGATGTAHKMTTEIAYARAAF
jgi:hypothetical protein